MISALPIPNLCFPSGTLTVGQESPLAAKLDCFFNGKGKWLRRQNPKPRAQDRTLVNKDPGNVHLTRSESCYEPQVHSWCLLFSPYLNVSSFSPRVLPLLCPSSNFSNWEDQHLRCCTFVVQTFGKKLTIFTKWWKTIPKELHLYRDFFREDLRLLALACYHEH